MCFNIEEQEGTNSRSRLVGNTSADVAYRDFLAHFIELSIERQQFFGIREIDNSVSAIRGHGNRIQNEQAEPFRIISVDCEGGISTFSPELLGPP